jgi:hypothetical protein
MRLKVAAALAVVLVSASPVFAFPIFGMQANELDINANIMVIGSVPPAGYGQGSTIVTMIGASLPIKLAAPFFIEPDVEFFGWPYRWTGTSAVPTASEDGLGFWVLGMLLSMQGGISYPVSPAVTLGGTIGLDLLVRFPLELQNSGPTVIEGEGSAMGYFYGALRFLYPETRFFLRWHLSDPIELLFNLRAWYPVFHLWDGQALPFLDQFMISAGIGVAISLTSPPSLQKAAPATAEPPAEAPAPAPPEEAPTTPQAR